MEESNFCPTTKPNQYAPTNLIPLMGPELNSNHHLKPFVPQWVLIGDWGANRRKMVKRAYNQRLKWKALQMPVKTYPYPNMANWGLHDLQCHWVWRETTPLRNNRTQNGKEKNRRIEFRIKGV